MDIITNSFCAGGVALGNGTWLNVGGNQAVGLAGLSVQPGDGPYLDVSGGQTVRTLTPCVNNGSCTAEWSEWTGMPVNRWYPSLVTLGDGSAMIIGGELWGGYVNDINQHQNNPTYEFVPPRAGGIVNMTFLEETQPLNLFPIVYMLPSGLIFLQAGNSTALYNIATQATTWIANMPGGQRVYPASAGVAALPMTPENNYTLTALFCGGLNQDANKDYDALLYDVTQYQGITDCHTITPDATPNQYDATDSLYDGTVQLNMVLLPDGRIFALGGCGQGTAGYGWQNYGNGQGYGKNPRLMPAGYYNHSAPSGQRWNRDGVSASTIPRMYHSSATLLPDASILVAGSNPNADFIGVTNTGISVNATDPFHTEYRVERFYPDYWGKARPVPRGMPKAIAYGGQYFNVSLPRENVTSLASLSSLKAVIIRTGFATHVINFGMAHVELPLSYTIESDGSATVYIAQLPPNPNVLAPGPALLFLVMHGVPSVGAWVTIGSGSIGQQPTSNAVALPQIDTSAGISPDAAGSNGSGLPDPLPSSDHTGAGDLSGGATAAITVCAVVAGIAALIGFGVLAIRRKTAGPKQPFAYSISNPTPGTSSTFFVDKDETYSPHSPSLFYTSQRSDSKSGLTSHAE